MKLRVQVNMHQAKSQLSQLAEQACRGEEVIIAKAGKPLVKLVPYTAAPQRQFGQFRDEFDMADDFDSKQVNNEVADMFEME